MARSVTTQLMFEGSAEEAMNFYISLFPDSKIDEINRYGPEGPGVEGKVMRALFTICGRQFACIDSPIKHDFGFTPAFSIFVDCEYEAELEGAYTKLLEGGKALMPLDNYGFSTQFGWVEDRFGVHGN